MAQSKPRAKPSVGIDLGTTYSCVAVFQNGRPEVIANNQGSRITPSVVAFTKDGRLIGEGAEIQRKLDPSNAIYNAKRFIGRTFEDPAVQASNAAYPFKVLEKNTKIQFQVKNGPRTLNLTPEEIAAAILGKMKKIAEDYLEETVKDVVITVPAYFTDSQRQATVNAGKISGLNVLRIINEPTAAAMAYGLREGTKENEGKHILVYDLGGGTFDVSVLEIEEDLIQVQATAGDSNLGGEDFNDIIVEHFKKEIFAQFKVDLTSNYKAIRRLTSACEKLKRNLSAENVTNSKLELDNFLPDGKDFVSSLTRAKFENLCKKRFDDTVTCVQKAIQDAGLTKEDIDEIVLVGGSSRIPKLQTMLSSFFDGKILNKSINPDEAVACGAAVQAAIINNDPHFAVKDMLLVDVIPLSIGVNVLGGISKIILERNTAIPVRRIERLSTTENNQTGCTFKITEGERTMTKDNKILGSFDMIDLPPKKAREVQVDVEYEIDENGILSVSATVCGTGMKAGITLDRRSPGKLPDDEVKRLVKEAETMKVIDQNEENRVLAMNKLTSLCAHISFVAQDLPVTEVNDVLKSIEDCLAWVDEHPDMEEAQFVSKYNELTEKASHVLSTSGMTESTLRSSHVQRIGRQKAKFCLKEGRDLLLSSNVKDKMKAGQYFFKAYKTAIDGGKLFNAIEALVLCGHTHRLMIESVTKSKLKLDLAILTVRSLTLVLDLEQNKTLSEEERKAVIADIQFGTDEVFNILEYLEDEEKFHTLNICMRALNSKNAKKNLDFCQIVFQSHVKEIKLILDKVNENLSNEDLKDAQKFIQILNYPKEEAKLLAKSFEEKQQITQLSEVIQIETLHVEGLNQINCAAFLLKGAEVDHPDTVDKSLMALDHLSEAKHLTQEAHPQVFIKANFFEGKIFMDYILNSSKAKSCFENVVTASERNHFNTEEYRESRYILEELQNKQLQEQGRTPTADRESLMGELREDLEKIKQADREMSDERFVDFLLTEYPPKHKENYKKPVITSDGSKKKAYIRLTTFYHPDKVDALKHGEKHKVLCGEISKYVNGRFMKM